MSVKPITIYLAGPMDSESVESSIGWRKKVWEYFESYINDGFVVLLDPCRRPHDADVTTDEIAIMDINDVQASDMLLSDIRYKSRENTGTSIEMYHCSKILGKPVFGWYDSDFPPTIKRVFIDWIVTRQFESLISALDHVLDCYVTKNNSTRSPY
jgi:nucleoside 2-deoxyribosyltransferase